MEHIQSADLKAARKKATFNAKPLTSVIWQGERRKQIDELVKIMSKEPLLDKDSRRHLSRQQLLERGYAIQLRITQLRREYGWNQETFELAMSLIDDHVPFGLHYNAFMPVVSSQGSDEQIAEWIPKCHDLEIIGCYAQTELGHGSNVQGLETIATFDKHTKDFVLDSPNLSSTKWWIGGLGTVANHAVVQAQLFIAGKNLGPHLFIVQIRDLKTHKPLKGIEVGDIGPKHYGGFNMNDNGFARFHMVRVPLANFLCRYAKIDADGNYKPASHAKIGYGSMVALRAGMPTVLGLELSKCVTIAIRYTTVRRQFDSASPATSDKLEDGATTNSTFQSKEMQVIKYSSVKSRLVPLLAKGYCYILTGHSIMAFYKKMLAALVQPPHDASLLAEVHLLTSGLKAALSWNVVDGMEESRKALGGHGFSIYSGIGERFAREVPGQTYEGDNYVLVQQTAKGLLKNVQLLMKGKQDQMMLCTQFLSKLPQDGVTGDLDWTDRKTQLTVLGLRVGAVLRDLATKAMSEEWSELNMECVRLTRAFVDHYVATTFTTEIAGRNIPADAKSALEKLASIYALDALIAGIPDLAEFSVIPMHNVKTLRQTLAKTIHSIEDDLVALTDAFGFTDWELNSILGKADGDVYKELWRTVNEKNPVNTSRVGGVVRGYQSLLRPLHHVARGTAKSLL